MTTKKEKKALHFDPNEFIPTNEPVLDGNEKRYALECFEKNWISAGGKFTKEFEEKFAKYLGVKHAVVCSNGTSAIHLALKALKIGKGDEVIIPDFTIICSASMTILSDAKPILVDVDKYWCIDPAKIEEKITTRTKAIMVVHMYGNPANMEEIMKIARKHKLFVIEDACAAHGAEVNGKKVGSMGDVNCFSFYASKNITSGEGGMVTTNNSKLAQRIRYLKSHCFEVPRFMHRELGFNYRMTDVQAAIGLAQLENINNKVARRREIASNYAKLFSGVKEIELPHDPPWGKSVFWMYSILINHSFGKSRDDTIRLLGKKGIGSERFFTPMSQQPVFQKHTDNRYPDIKGNYAMSWDIGKRGMYIPSGLNLSFKQQERIAKTLLSLIN